ncbi:MAG TPA: hypothetical protein VIQ55_14760 [Burkholderiales bacterium]|jgi:hypothetical protein
MNAYVLLAVFAVILVAILAFGVRLITNALRGRREASAVARRTGPASDYYARTLRQAAEVVGGEENLAAALKIAPDALRPWLQGEESPPIEVHLAALDLVTRGTPKPPEQKNAHTR